MPDRIARKRLKQKMLDRWENEGGAIGPDATTQEDTNLTSRDKKPGQNLLNTSNVKGPASPLKSPKTTRK